MDSPIPASAEAAQDELKAVTAWIDDIVVRLPVVRERAGFLNGFIAAHNAIAAAAAATDETGVEAALDGGIAAADDAAPTASAVTVP